MKALEDFERPFDALIVGAGPAGLAAAYKLLRNAPNIRVLIVDGGNDLEDRLNAQRVMIEHDGPNTDLVEGVGGAGLFSDGKLCLSLDVGGDLPAKVSEAVRCELLEEVKRLFHADEYQVTPQADTDDWTLDWGPVSATHYPVAHIGTDRAAFRIEQLRGTLRQLGATIAARTLLGSVARLPMGFRVTLHATRPDRTVYVDARALVLCLGKVGADKQRQTCCDLGVIVDPLPMYIGVRLETDSTLVERIFKPGQDAKFKLAFDDGSKMKTHCVAAGGSILPLSYSGLLLAGGHSTSSSPGGRTSVSLLWNGIKLRSDAMTMARKIMSDVIRETDGRLLVQRLHDYRSGRPSTGADIRECSPTTVSWAAGDIMRVMPADYFSHLDEFLSNLERLAPRLDSPRTILFAPSIEWWASRVQTDELMGTSCPGLFVAGDGAGWSQGIVHAAATGLLAGQGALSYLGVPSESELRLRELMRLGDRVPMA